MSNEDRDNSSIDSEDIDMLRQMFGITTEDENHRFNTVINQLKEEYGFVDKQILVQRLLQEFGVDPEFFQQIQDDMADLHMDHLDHLLHSQFQFQSTCTICQKQHTELCEHLKTPEKLEILLQLGEIEKGMKLLDDTSFNKLEKLLWRIRFLFIDHKVSEIKSLLDDASQIIYDNDDLFDIFRVQVLKIHYLLDQKRYDEALKVADSISPFAEKLELEGNNSIKYWMASLSQGMASALLKMGQVQVALDPLLVSTDLFIEIENKYQVAISFALISSVMGILQQSSKAQEAARIALQMMSALDNDFGLIRVKTFVASGFLALFETDIAMDYASEALEMALDSDKKTIIAALYGLIAQIHLVSQQYEEAFEVAGKCFEYAEQQEINEIKAIAISLKGDIFAEQKKIKDAINYYEQAIELLEDGKDDQIILDLDRRIAELEQLK